MRLHFILGMAMVGVLGAGCGGGVSLGSVPNGLGADQDGSDGGSGAGSPGNPGTGGPYDISCTMYFQPATSDRQESFSVRSDASGQKTISFPGYTIDASYGPSNGAPDSTLTIAVREAETVQSYRLSPAHSPSQEYVGDHGFTGLIYVGADVQYVCKASQVAPSGKPEPNGAPINIGCTVELRAGGVVEKTETLAFTAAGTERRQLGEFGVSASLHDSAFEGRAMYISLWKPPFTEDNYSIRQLFQFDRTRTLVNPLADGTFSGRTALGSNRDVSYTCAAR